MYNAPYQGVANNLAQYGRFGDSQLVHMNPIEVQMLSRLSPIGLTTNPMTGQKEAFLPFLLPLLGSFAGKAALGATLGTAFGSAALGTAAAGAIGSGLTTAAVTGDLEQGIMAGITGFGIGSALGGGFGTPDAANLANAAPEALSGIPESIVNATTLPSVDALQAQAFADSSAQTVADAATQQTVADAATNAATQSGVPQSFLNATNASTPLDALKFAELDVKPFLNESFSGTVAEAVPPPTFMQNLGRQSGDFISNLANPSSFLPVYVGETYGEARRQELAGEGSAKAYEEEQEATRNRIRGQMSDVFNQVRSAYPGRGYAAGGIVEKYAEGGFNIDQDLVNSLRFSNLPEAKQVQLDLRGNTFIRPPTASYSALDVGGEGYLPGVSDEFKYFKQVDLPPPSDGNTGTTGSSEGSPFGGGYDFNTIFDQYGGFGRGFNAGDDFGGGRFDRIDDFAGVSPPVSPPPIGRGDMDFPGYRGGNPNFDFTGGMADDAPVYTGEESRIDFSPKIDFTGGMADDMPVYKGGSSTFDEGGFDRPIMEELLSSQFNPIREQPDTPDFNPPPPDFTDFSDFSGMRNIQFSPITNEYSPPPDFSGFDNGRIPSYTPPDFSGFEDMPVRDTQYRGDAMPPIQQQISDLQSGIGSLQSRPQPSFDLADLEQQLAFMENLRSPQVSFDPTMERMSSLEDLLASQRSAPSQDMSSFQNPFDEFSMADGFAEGGMTGMDNQSQMGDENSIVEMTVAAIRGEIENVDQIISRFVEMYGPEVFMQLRERVLQDIVPGAQTEGMVEGMGGGQDDLVEGMIGTQRPVAVSPGEYIIPADVVSLAGGGYSGNGASFFDGLVDDIRQKTMGTTKQVRPYQRSV